jgi:hypothetical protein
MDDAGVVRFLLPDFVEDLGRLRLVGKCLVGLERTGVQRQGIEHGGLAVVRVALIHLLHRLFVGDRTSLIIAFHLGEIAIRDAVPYFSQKQLVELDEQRGKLVHQYLKLVSLFQTRTYRSERGREYALHGFGRRLEILRTAIDEVFTVLPPEREGQKMKNVLGELSLFKLLC